MDSFAGLSFGVDGDSITAGGQWAQYVFETLGMEHFHNVAVGSAVWHKRTYSAGGKYVCSQDYTDSGFVGISDGWLPTDDTEELQKRANNCAVVHIQRYIEDVRTGKAKAPDIFAFAMGTNDLPENFGDPARALSGKSLENNDNIDLFTTAGAMRWCIQRICEEFPEARVFLLTPIQAADPPHNFKNEKLINGIMLPIARAMSVQVIDCYAGCGICSVFEKINESGRYLRDGLHPDVPGQKLEGAFAAKEIRKNMFAAE